MSVLPSEQLTLESTSEGVDSEQAQCARGTRRICTPPEAPNNFGMGRICSDILCRCEEPLALHALCPSSRLPAFLNSPPDLHLRLLTLNISGQLRQDVQFPKRLFLPSLQRLWLDRNGLTDRDLQPLSRLRELRFLSLRGNRLRLPGHESISTEPESSRIRVPAASTPCSLLRKTPVYGICNLVLSLEKLQQLDVSENLLVSLFSRLASPSLQVVLACSNRLTDCSFLASVSKAQSCGDHAASCQWLPRGPALPLLEFVDLRGNADVTCVAGLDRVPQLKTFLVDGDFRRATLRPRTTHEGDGGVLSETVEGEGKARQKRAEDARAACERTQGETHAEGERREHEEAEKSEEGSGGDLEEDWSAPAPHTRSRAEGQKTHEVIASGLDFWKGLGTFYHSNLQVLTLTHLRKREAESAASHPTASASIPSTVHQLHWCLPSLLRLDLSDNDLQRFPSFALRPSSSPSSGAACPGGLSGYFPSPSLHSSSASPFSSLLSLSLAGNLFGGPGNAGKASVRVALAALAALELPSLQHLDLSRCSLGALPASLFNGKQKLRVLLLNENNLEHTDDFLQALWGQKLPSLQHLSLRNNPLTRFLYLPRTSRSQGNVSDSIQRCPCSSPGTSAVDFHPPADQPWLATVDEASFEATVLAESQREMPTSDEECRGYVRGRPRRRAPAARRSCSFTEGLDRLGRRHREGESPFRRMPVRRRRDCFGDHTARGNGGGERESSRASGKRKLVHDGSLGKPAEERSLRRQGRGASNAMELAGVSRVAVEQSARAGRRGSAKSRRGPTIPDFVAFLEPRIPPVLPFDIAASPRRGSSEPQPADSISAPAESSQRPRSASPAAGSRTAQTPASCHSSSAPAPGAPHLGSESSVGSPPLCQSLRPSVRMSPSLQPAARGNEISLASSRFCSSDSARPSSHPLSSSSASGPRVAPSLTVGDAPSSQESLQSQRFSSRESDRHSPSCLPALVATSSPGSPSESSAPQPHASACSHLRTSSPAESLLASAPCPASAFVSAACSTAAESNLRRVRAAAVFRPPRAGVPHATSTPSHASGVNASAALSGPQEDPALFVSSVSQATEEAGLEVGATDLQGCPAWPVFASSQLSTSPLGGSYQSVDEGYLKLLSVTESFVAPPDISSLSASAQSLNSLFISQSNPPFVSQYCESERLRRDREESHSPLSRLSSPCGGHIPGRSLSPSASSQFLFAAVQFEQDSALSLSSSASSSHRSFLSNSSSPLRNSRCPSSPFAPGSSAPVGLASPCRRRKESEGDNRYPGSVSSLRVHRDPIDYFQTSSGDFTPSLYAGGTPERNQEEPLSPAMLPTPFRSCSSTGNGPNGPASPGTPEADELPTPGPRRFHAALPPQDSARLDSSAEEDRGQSCLHPNSGSPSFASLLSCSLSSSSLSVSARPPASLPWPAPSSAGGQKSEQSVGQRGGDGRSQGLHAGRPSSPGKLALPRASQRLSLLAASPCRSRSRSASTPPHIFAWNTCQTSFTCPYIRRRVSPSSAPPSPHFRLLHITEIHCNSSDGLTADLSVSRVSGAAISGDQPTARGGCGMKCSSETEGTEASKGERQGQQKREAARPGGDEITGGISFQAKEGNGDESARDNNAFVGPLMDPVDGHMAPGEAFRALEVKSCSLQDDAVKCRKEPDSDEGEASLGEAPTWTAGRTQRRMQGSEDREEGAAAPHAPAEEGDFYSPRATARVNGESVESRASGVTDAPPESAAGLGILPLSETLWLSVCEAPESALQTPQRWLHFSCHQAGSSDYGAATELTDDGPEEEMEHLETGEKEDRKHHRQGKEKQSPTEKGTGNSEPHAGEWPPVSVSQNKSDHTAKLSAFCATPPRDDWLGVTARQASLLATDPTASELGDPAEGEDSANRAGESVKDGGMDREKDGGSLATRDTRRPELSFESGTLTAHETASVCTRSSLSPCASLVGKLRRDPESSETLVSPHEQNESSGNRLGYEEGPCTRESVEGATAHASGITQHAAVRRCLWADARADDSDGRGEGRPRLCLQTDAAAGEERPTCSSLTVPPRCVPSPSLSSVAQGHPRAVVAHAADNVPEGRTANAGAVGEWDEAAVRARHNGLLKGLEKTSVPTHWEGQPHEGGSETWPTLLSMSDRYHPDVTGSPRRGPKTTGGEEAGEASRVDEGRRLEDGQHVTVSAASPAARLEAAGPVHFSTSTCGTDGLGKMVLPTTAWSVEGEKSDTPLLLGLRMETDRKEAEWRDLTQERESGESHTDDEEKGDVDRNEQNESEGLATEGSRPPAEQRQVKREGRRVTKRDSKPNKVGAGFSSVPRPDSEAGEQRDARVPEEGSESLAALDGGVNHFFGPRSIEEAKPEPVQVVAVAGAKDMCAVASVRCVPSAGHQLQPEFGRRHARDDAVGLSCSLLGCKSPTPPHSVSLYGSSSSSSCFALASSLTLDQSVCTGQDSSVEAHRPSLPSPESADGAVATGLPAMASPFPAFPSRRASAFRSVASLAVQLSSAEPGAPAFRVSLDERERTSEKGGWAQRNAGENASVCRERTTGGMSAVEISSCTQLTAGRGAPSFSTGAGAGVEQKRGASDGAEWTMVVARGRAHEGGEREGNLSSGAFSALKDSLRPRTTDPFQRSETASHATESLKQGEEHFGAGGCRPPDRGTRTREESVSLEILVPDWHPSSDPTPALDPQDHLSSVRLQVAVAGMPAEANSASSVFGSCVKDSRGTRHAVPGSPVSPSELSFSVSSSSSDPSPQSPSSVPFTAGDAEPAASRDGRNCGVEIPRCPVELSAAWAETEPDEGEACGRRSGLGTETGEPSKCPASAPAGASRLETPPGAFGSTPVSPFPSLASPSSHQLVDGRHSDDDQTDPRGMARKGEQERSRLTGEERAFLVPEPAPFLPRRAPRRRLCPSPDLSLSSHPSTPVGAGLTGIHPEVTPREQRMVPEGQGAQGGRAAEGQSPFRPMTRGASSPRVSRSENAQERKSDSERDLAPESSFDTVRERGAGRTRTADEGGSSRVSSERVEGTRTADLAVRRRGAAGAPVTREVREAGNKVCSEDESRRQRRSDEKQRTMLRRWPSSTKDEGEQEARGSPDVSLEPRRTPEGRVPENRTPAPRSRTPTVSSCNCGISARKPWCSEGLLGLAEALKSRETACHALACLAACTRQAAVGAASVGDAGRCGGMSLSERFTASSQIENHGETWIPVGTCQALIDAVAREIRKAASVRRQLGGRRSQGESCSPSRASSASTFTSFDSASEASSSSVRVWPSSDRTNSRLRSSDDRACGGARDGRPTKATPAGEDTLLVQAVKSFEAIAENELLSAARLSGSTGSPVVHWDTGLKVISLFIARCTRASRQRTVHRAGALVTTDTSAGELPQRRALPGSPPASGRSGGGVTGGESQAKSREPHGRHSVSAPELRESTGASLGAQGRQEVNFTGSPAPPPMPQRVLVGHTSPGTQVQRFAEGRGSFPVVAVPTAQSAGEATSIPGARRDPKEEMSPLRRIAEAASHVRRMLEDTSGFGRNTFADTSETAGFRRYSGSRTREDPRDRVADAPRDALGLQAAEPAFPSEQYPARGVQGGGEAAWNALEDMRQQLEGPLNALDAKLIERAERLYPGETLHEDTTNNSQRGTSLPAVRSTCRSRDSPVAPSSTTFDPPLGLDDLVSDSFERSSCESRRQITPVPGSVDAHPPRGVSGPVGSRGRQGPLEVSRVRLPSSQSFSAPAANLGGGAAVNLHVKFSASEIVRARPGGCLVLAYPANWKSGDRRTVPEKTDNPAHAPASRGRGDVGRWFGALLAERRAKQERMRDERRHRDAEKQRHGADPKRQELMRLAAKSTEALGRVMPYRRHEPLLQTYRKGAANSGSSVSWSKSQDGVCRPAQTGGVQRERCLTKVEDRRRGNILRPVHNAHVKPRSGPSQRREKEAREGDSASKGAHGNPGTGADARPRDTQTRHQAVLRDEQVRQEVPLKHPVPEQQGSTLGNCEPDQRHAPVSNRGEECEVFGAALERSSDASERAGFILLPESLADSTAQKAKSISRRDDEPGGGGVPVRARVIRQALHDHESGMDESPELDKEAESERTLVALVPDGERTSKGLNGLSSSSRNASGSGFSAANQCRQQTENWVALTVGAVQNRDGNCRLEGGEEGQSREARRKEASAETVVIPFDSEEARIITALMAMRADSPLLGSAQRSCYVYCPLRIQRTPHAGLVSSFASFLWPSLFRPAALIPASPLTPAGASAIVGGPAQAKPRSREGARHASPGVSLGLFRKAGLPRPRDIRILFFCAPSVRVLREAFQAPWGFANNPPAFSATDEETRPSRRQTIPVGTGTAGGHGAVPQSGTGEGRGQRTADVAGHPQWLLFGRTVEEAEDAARRLMKRRRQLLKNYVQKLDVLSLLSTGEASQASEALDSKRVHRQQRWAALRRQTAMLGNGQVGKRRELLVCAVACGKCFPVCAEEMTHRASVEESMLRAVDDAMQEGADSVYFEALGVIALLNPARAAPLYHVQYDATLSTNYQEMQ
uniref:Leucine rich repeat-containing protein n=1 Tax=Neospora caninum (strain Liverpool) TaxID=572307 RepID=A0A0F7U7F8_NEOCL|nr:TPA: hypothetical protein BN1204_002450 [Neospora caninum Liverpool]